MTDRNPIPVCLSHLTQRDAAVRARALEEAVSSVDNLTIHIEQTAWDAGFNTALNGVEDAIHALVPTPPAPAPDEATSYQARVHQWISHCFGPEIGADKVERNHRFLEEALELVQSGDCTASEAHQLVDYVFARPVGEMFQEVGGVMNTLAALCNTHGVNLDAAAEAELTRVWSKSEQIRAKQAAKPKHSPLPQSSRAEPTPGEQS